jgi:very-short-patch-repair endonuclease
VSHPLERHCPTCGAGAGKACIGRRGIARKALHRARGARRYRAFDIQPVDDLATESPIEETLAGAIRGWIDHHGVRAFVQTQARVGPFRADILVTVDSRKLAVECDGAEFHSSAEQVTRDKRRDRFFVARGVSVMRFCGHEINRDPRACAIEVGAWITLP